MKLLFENWRAYLLNEISLDQARQRLETKVTKKLVKSSLYDLRKDYGDPFNLADDELEDMVVFNGLLENETYIKVFAKIYGYDLYPHCSGCGYDVTIPEAAMLVYM